MKRVPWLAVGVVLGALSGYYWWASEELPMLWPDDTIWIAYRNKVIKVGGFALAGLLFGLAFDMYLRRR